MVALPIGNGERTGFRDNDKDGISTLHRKWHLHLGFTDIDSMWFEFVLGIPMAVVDYKKRAPFKLDPTEMYIRGYQNVSNALRVPYFMVFYQTDPYPYFTARPMNTFAFEFIAEDTVMSEFEFVIFQFKVRRHPVPPGALSRDNRAELSRQKPHVPSNIPF